mgnify:CR=1 FL=1
MQNSENKKLNPQRKLLIVACVCLIVGLFTVLLSNNSKTEDNEHHNYIATVMIDAGHGGKDSGATGNGYIEKNMTLKIVQNIKTNFDSDPLYKVYYTRLSDWYPTLTERYDLANTVNADRFLSVHINSADSASAKGTETLYKDYKTYASVIHSSSLNGMGYTKGSSYDRSLVYRPGLAVLRGTKMMSALAEMGFISNSTESARIDARSEAIGSALYQAICNSFN